MHRSLHISTFILILINVCFALILITHNFSSFYIWLWGGSGNTHLAIQSLSEFPPFCLHPIASGPLTIALSGTTLLIVRAVYASFLHFSLFHLASNAFALYELGYAFESLNYPGLLIPTYLISGCFSMIEAGKYNPNTLTAGASGAIFGIMGAMVILALKAMILAHYDKLDDYTAQTYSDVGANVWIAILQNLVVTFTTPGISIPGHVFGLLAGCVCGLLIPIRKAS